ncbi:MAG: hypothetical protein WC406_05855 [Methanoregula sp.]|jgi:hypothetical protein
MINAKIAQRQEEWKFEDAKNSLLCHVIAACAGNKHTSPADFRILHYDPRDDMDTPAEIANTLSMLGGG